MSHTLSHPVSVILVLTVLKAVHTEAACWVSLAVPAIIINYQVCMDTNASGGL